MIIIFIEINLLPLQSRDFRNSLDGYWSPIFDYYRYSSI